MPVGKAGGPRSRKPVATGCGASVAKTPARKPVSKGGWKSKVSHRPSKPARSVSTGCGAAPATPRHRPAKPVRTGC